MCPSLMGISKIFKDKPKDEDAALPEKEAKKKDKKGKKGKADVAPAAISHATAEVDRLTEEEDRALAGLSPAAKVARQHTLRSKAEAAKKEVDQTVEPAAQSHQVLPSIVSVTGPEIVHVTPRQGPTVVHAVAVSEHEYDSEDDSSEGETVEDVTVNMGRTRLSDEADAEFQATWGNAYIDRHAVPKKGILKSAWKSAPSVVREVPDFVQVSLQSRTLKRQPTASTPTSITLVPTHRLTPLSRPSIHPLRMCLSLPTRTHPSIHPHPTSISSARPSPILLEA